MNNASATHSQSVASEVQEIPRPPACAPRGSVFWMVQNLLRWYARARHALVRSRIASTHFEALREIRECASTLTDIDEHMELMFIEALLCRPEVIVELGVRGGASTFVFDKVSRLCDASLISVDLDDCSFVNSSSRWHFVRSDDVRFASTFPEFCRQRGIRASVDLLFIDTSHYYDHTVREISAWFPLLSSRAKVIFHDTNLKPIGRRKDGCVQVAWDNERGVVRALEEYFGLHIEESCEGTEYVGGWLMRHWPNCNGLTIFDRIRESSGVRKFAPCLTGRKSA
jgi:cephalosporin hydroxylase